ncbi:Uncharacterised protein [Vibrio cholerae]|nr:Uncharacterised protein [Vibrio cholerae]CSI56784.1 Uncharacterised protein [Vibrio cholerae]
MPLHIKQQYVTFCPLGHQESNRPSMRRVINELQPT